jgi:hypothetical protein
MSYIANERAPLFQPDYLISWDCNDAGMICLTVATIECDKEHPERVVARVLGSTDEKTGVFSLRQLIEYRAAEDRHQKERECDAERLRQTFSQE